MRHVVIAVSLLFLIAGSTAWWLFNPTLQDRAFRAYQAGRYAEALPLLKQWAATPAIRNNRDSLKVALAYVADAEQRLKGASSGSGNPAPPPPGNSQALVAQAQAAVAQSGMGSAAPGDPAKGADRILHKKPAPGEMLTMTIKELGNFDFNPETDSTVPPDVQALEGAKVRLPGFMLPISQTEKVTDFALIPSLMGCCFGQPPGVEHIITARTPADKAVDYTVEEIWVEGILHIRVQRKESFTFSIFELDVTSVKIKE